MPCGPQAGNRIQMSQPVYHCVISDEIYDDQIKNFLAVYKFTSLLFQRIMQLCKSYKSERIYLSFHNLHYLYYTRTVINLIYKKASSIFRFF